MTPAERKLAQKNQVKRFAEKLKRTKLRSENLNKALFNPHLVGANLTVDSENNQYFFVNVKTKAAALKALKEVEAKLKDVLGKGEKVVGFVTMASTDYKYGLHVQTAALENVEHDHKYIQNFVDLDSIKKM